MVETSLAVLLAAGLGLVGVTATAAQLASFLFAVSFAGLVVLLVRESRFSRRWKVRKREKGEVRREKAEGRSQKGEAGSALDELPSPFSLLSCYGQPTDDLTCGNPTRSSSGLTRTMGATDRL